jgi:hypothetical protein
MFEWTRSGAQVRVTLKGGWRYPDNSIQPVPIPAFDASNPQPGARPVLIVEVVNRGRGATEISEWWVRIGTAYSGMTHPADATAIAAMIDAGLADAVTAKIDDILLEGHNERCPYTLAGTTRNNWVIAADKVADQIRTLIDKGQPVDMGALVNYGGDKSAKSDQHIDPRSIGLI